MFPIIVLVVDHNGMSMILFGYFGHATNSMAEVNALYWSAILHVERSFSEVSVEADDFVYFNFREENGERERRMRMVKIEHFNIKNMTMNYWSL